MLPFRIDPLYPVATIIISLSLYPWIIAPLALQPFSPQADHRNFKNHHLRVTSVYDRYLSHLWAWVDFCIVNFAEIQWQSISSYIFNRGGY